MQLRHWLMTSISLGFLFGATGASWAQETAAEPAAPAAAAAALALPQACVDAGAATEADCKALIAEQKAAAKAEADKAAAADKATAEKAAADKAAADKAAADKAAADKAAADKASADKAAAAEQAAADKAAAKAAADKKAAEAAAATEKAAAADKAAADKAAADKAAADKAAADKAAADQSAADKAAADKTAADKAAADKAAADKAAADKAAAGQSAADKAAADKTAADKAAADKAAADKAAAPPAAAAQPAPPAAEAAPAPAPAAETPAPAEVSPAKPATAKPAAPEAAAQPDITKPLTAAANAYNASVAALGKSSGDKAATDKARSDIEAQRAQIDALCKSVNQEVAQCLAQYALALSPIPAAATPGGAPVAVAPVQPVEVVPNLPKGVSRDEVAPLFDSAKDAERGQGDKAGRPSRNKPAATAAEPAPNAPPPADDKAAQADITPAKITPIDQTKGQVIAADAAAPQVQVPQNVTIINQTEVNNTTNTTTTTTTNNTTNNGTAQKPGDRPARGDNRPGNATDNGPRGPGRGDGRPAGEVNPIGLGLQVIMQIGNQLIVNSPARDQRRIADNDRDKTTYEQLSGERYRETITRENGVRIVTVYNRNGDILRRSRFDRAGHETVLAYFDASHDEDLLNWRDPGDDLPPLRLNIPARDYVLDADRADERQVQQFFAQPPVERVQRLYSINEVKRSARIRDMVRRLEIGDLTFDTGASTISEDQVANLENVAQAMLGLLKRNPAETFLIEGHTDAVGSDISNLRLSDARAATVAMILTDFYHIPPENLATQGYGERFLIVQTPGPEPLNRRVTIRRITPLVTVANQ